MPARHEVDFDDDEQVELAGRLGRSWRDMRRGAAMALLRDRLFGTDLGALEPGQVDTLELIVQQPEWRMSELADALRVARCNGWSPWVWPNGRPAATTAGW